MNSQAHDAAFLAYVEKVREHSARRMDDLLALKRVCANSECEKLLFPKPGESPGAFKVRKNCNKSCGSKASSQTRMAQKSGHEARKKAVAPELDFIGWGQPIDMPIVHNRTTNYN